MLDNDKPAITRLKNAPRLNFVSKVYTTDLSINVQFSFFLKYVNRTFEQETFMQNVVNELSNQDEYYRV